MAERRAAARAMGGADNSRGTGPRGASTPAAVSTVCWIRKPSSSWGRSQVIPPFRGRSSPGPGRSTGRPGWSAPGFTVAGGRSAPRPHPSALEPRSSRCANRTPLVMMLEGAGIAPPTRSSGPAAPNDLSEDTADCLSGLVPTVAILTGPSAGHGALAAPLSDFGSWSVGTARCHRGPAMVAAPPASRSTNRRSAVRRSRIDTSGVAHNLAESDDAALALARRYLSYFTSSAWQRPPWVGPDGGNHEWGERALPELLDLVRSTRSDPTTCGRCSRPSRTRAPSPRFSDVRDVDHHRAGRIGGHAVAVVANQPTVTAGAGDGGGRGQSGGLPPTRGRLPPAVLSSPNNRV
ncbi:hypothetical protein GS491_27030 [Rhodococcus hoagii]|nr:hypothetical protein [Prescottella equi]